MFCSTCEQLEMCTAAPGKCPLFEFVQAFEAVDAEAIATIDDIRELRQREIQLRQAHKHLEIYINDWQKQLRRMTKEIEALEKERLQLEASEVIQKQMARKQKDESDKLLASFLKLPKEQQELLKKQWGM